MRCVLMIAAVLLALAVAGCGAVQSRARGVVHPCPPAQMTWVLWSPDSSKLAYLMGGEIYSIELATEKKTHLGSGAFPDAWSPDGSHLLLMAGSEGWIVSADGGQPIMVPDLYTGYSASWSPDGSKLIHGSVSMPYHLAVFDLASRQSTVLFAPPNTGQGFGWARWSPDGERIAFTYMPDPYTYNLMVINADGSNPVEWNQDYDLLSLVWSPDSTQVAFFGVRQTLPALYIANADGTGLKHLSNHVGASLQWLPDGSGLIIAAITPIMEGSHTVGGDYSIIRVGLDGSVAPLSDIAPTGTVSISPDATKVAYISSRYGHPDLYVMNVDGTDLVRLTRNPGYSTCFDWPFP